MQRGSQTFCCRTCCHLIVALEVRDSDGVLPVKVEAVLDQELDRLGLYDVLLRTQQSQIIHLDQVRVWSLEDTRHEDLRALILNLCETSEWIQEDLSLHLLIQLLVTGDSERKDGAGASCVANGLVSVLYGPEPGHNIFLEC